MHHRETPWKLSFSLKSAQETGLPLQRRLNKTKAKHTEGTLKLCDLFNVCCGAKQELLPKFTRMKVKATTHTHIPTHKTPHKHMQTHKHKHTHMHTYFYTHKNKRTNTNVHTARNTSESTATNTNKYGHTQHNHKRSNTHFNTPNTHAHVFCSAC